MMAHVEAVFELCKVLGQMFGAYMNVRAPDAVLEVYYQVPETQRA